MLKFKLDIVCENDAFKPSVVREVGALMLDVIVAMRQKKLTAKSGSSVPILDTNGNVVGRAKFVEED